MIIDCDPKYYLCLLSKRLNILEGMEGFFFFFLKRELKKTSLCLSKFKCKHKRIKERKNPEAQKKQKAKNLVIKIRKRRSYDPITSTKTLFHGQKQYLEMGKGERQEMKRIAYKGYLVHQKFYRIIGIEGKTRVESLPSNLIPRRPKLFLSN